MRFTKMHGLGNDYIYLYENDLDKNIDKSDYYYSNLAIKLSDRHFGVGGDGIILIRDSSKGDFFMQVYNADGSKGEMCGNGIRCVGKYVYERGLTNKTELKIDTMAGLKNIELILKDNKVTDVRVDMGKPTLHDGSTLRLTKCCHDLKIDGVTYSVMDVSIGNPHTVVFVDELTDDLVLKVGPLIENNPFYPHRTNVEFVQAVDDAKLNMLVWERGSGETLACGTGASAAATAFMLKNPQVKKVQVNLKGGILNIEWQDNNHIIMTGSATKVFEGEVEEDIIK